MRPKFHFAPLEGYMGDPNGLVYYKGLYHLFYQHRVDFSLEKVWGPFFWGHATSPNLIDWTEKEQAFPVKKGTNAFSGSGIVDYNNISGLKVGEDDPILLFWTEVELYTTKTYAIRLSYSTDGGKTFTVHPKKLIEVPDAPEGICCDRDPMVIFHKESGKFILVFYGEYYSKSKKPSFVIFSSEDIFNWEYESEIPSLFECADIMELPVRGTKERKWVFIDAPGDYMVGDFDSKKFTPCQDIIRPERNMPNYACQSWKYEGKVIQTGVTLMPKFKGERWQQQMTFPAELGLKKDSGKYLLTKTPIEIKKELVYKANNIKARDINALNMDNLDTCEIDIEAIWNPWTSLSLFTYSGIVSFEFFREQVLCGCAFPLKEAEKVKIKIFVDRTSMEVFVNDTIFIPLPKREDWNCEKFKTETFLDRDVLIESIKIYKI